MSSRGFVLSIALISLVIFGTLCSDDAQGNIGHTFGDGIFEFEVIGTDNVRVISYTHLSGGHLVIPSSATDSDDGSKEYTVTSIGPYIHINDEMTTPITSLFIPDTITDIRPGALSFMDLESVSVDGSNPVYKVEDNTFLYNDATKAIVRYFSGLPNTEYEIPNWVLSLNAHSFYFADDLVELKHLPDSMKAIEDGTFQNCTSLSKINYDADKGQNTLPSGLLYIGMYAFSSCDSLNSIFIPESLVMIDSYAFSYNSGLKSFYIPYNVTYIGESVFYASNSLENITVSSENEKYLSRNGVLFTEGGNPKTMTLMHYPAKKADVKYVIPSNVSDIASMAFYSTSYLREIVFNDLFVTIPNSALAHSTSLEKITLSSNTLAIGSSAFSGCFNLATIVGGDSVQTIGDWAFSHTSLSAPFLPKEIEHLSNYAFYNCLDMEHVSIPKTVLYMGTEVFGDCFNIKSITFEGIDTKLDEDSLSVGDVDNIVFLDVRYYGGMSFPSDVCTLGYTELNYIEIDKEPYPWENLIGVAVCILIVFGIFALFREV